MFYKMNIAGVERELPLCPLNENLYIGAFVMFGDVEITVKAAEALCKIAPEHDLIITAESKGIPLAYEMSRYLGGQRYVLARKTPKLYMRDVIKCETQSITTASKQTLYINGEDAEYMKGKRVLIVDDVISTGGSLISLENLVEQTGGTVVGKMTILAEGEAADRKDIVYLEKLPLFNGKGEAL